jgi:hypothetical protein
MAPVVVALIVGAALYWLYSTGPLGNRGQPISQIAARVGGLSWMVDGSTLTVRHEATGRSFSFVKAPDVVRFVFPENEWSTESFEATQEGLREASFVGDLEIEGTSPERVLSCSLAGQERSIEFLADCLTAQLFRTLSIGKQEKATFRLDGGLNYDIAERRIKRRREARP